MGNFKSVSNFIKEFEEYKDWNSIAEHYAKRTNVSAQSWLDIWNLPKPKKVISDSYVNNLNVDFRNLTPGTYEHLTIYSPRFKLLGRPDKIIIYHDKTFKIEIDKFFNEIGLDALISYNEANNKSRNTKYLYPINHLVECNLNYYKLQLSIYAFILEEYGFVCQKLEANHYVYIKEDDGRKAIELIEVYECKYLKKEVRLLLNHAFTIQQGKLF